MKYTIQKKLKYYNYGLANVNTYIFQY